MEDGWLDGGWTENGAKMEDCRCMGDVQRIGGDKTHCVRCVVC